MYTSIVYTIYLASQSNLVQFFSCLFVQKPSALWQGEIYMRIPEFNQSYKTIQHISYCCAPLQLAHIYHSLLVLLLAAASDQQLVYTIVVLVGPY